VGMGLLRDKTETEKEGEQLKPTLKGKHWGAKSKAGNSNLAGRAPFPSTGNKACKSEIIVGRIQTDRLSTKDLWKC